MPYNVALDTKLTHAHNNSIVEEQISSIFYLREYNYHDVCITQGIGGPGLISAKGLYFLLLKVEMCIDRKSVV